MEGDDGGNGVEGEAVVFADDHRAFDFGEFSGAVFRVGAEEFSGSFLSGFKFADASVVFDGQCVLAEGDPFGFALSLAGDDSPSGQFGLCSGLVCREVLHDAGLGEGLAEGVFKGGGEVAEGDFGAGFDDGAFVIATFLLVGFEQAGGEEEVFFYGGSGAFEEGAPEFSFLVFAVFAEGEVVSREGNGGGVQSVVHVGQAANVGLGFGSSGLLAFGFGNFREKSFPQGFAVGVFEFTGFHPFFEFFVRLGGGGAFQFAEGGVEDFRADEAEGPDEIPGFAKFGGDRAGDGIDDGVRKTLFQPAHGELGELAGLGEFAFGEAEILVIHVGGEEESFAGLFPADIIGWPFGVEVIDEGFVLGDGEDAEVFAVGDGLASFIENELAGGALAFPAVDFRGSENEGVEGVGVPAGKGDDVLALHVAKIIGFKMLTGERALPIHVHGDSGFADQSAVQSEVWGVFFQVGHGGFEILHPAVEFGGDFFGGFPGEFLQLAGHFDHNLGDDGFSGHELRADIIGEAPENQHPVADEVVIGKLVEGAFGLELADAGGGIEEGVEDAVFGFPVAFGIGIVLGGASRVEALEDFLDDLF